MAIHLNLGHGQEAQQKEMGIHSRAMREAKRMGKQLVNINWIQLCVYQRWVAVIFPAHKQELVPS